MTAPAFHLAQANVAIPIEPPGSELLAEFMARLDEVNAVADAAPGFVWRLQTEEGNATALRPFEDDRILINMSVWTTPAALDDFLYRSVHTEVMRRRREWFIPLREAISVAWWVQVGTIPTVADAAERLALLRTEGPTARAFSPRKPFDPPAV